MKEIVDDNCQERDTPFVIQMSQHPGHLLQDKSTAFIIFPCLICAFVPNNSAVGWDPKNYLLSKFSIDNQEQKGSDKFEFMPCFPTHASSTVSANETSPFHDPHHLRMFSPCKKSALWTSTLYGGRLW